MLQSLILLVSLLHKATLGKPNVAAVGESGHDPPLSHSFISTDMRTSTCPDY